MATLTALTFASVALAGVRPPGVTSSGESQLLGHVDPIKFTEVQLSRPRPDSVQVASGPKRGAGDSLRTSCRAVVHVGDSTSIGLVSTDFLPNRARRISAQYARVGVLRRYFEIDGATSVVETLPGHVNAQEVAEEKVRAGYGGCWVLALGNNDTANVYVGSSFGLSSRIRRMMSTIGNRPVMWVNVKTLQGSGPYAGTNMRRWNQELMQACSRYPNMRIFDWAAIARDHWFGSDGIHFTSPGNAARARLIADALARGFPAQGPSPSCLVRTNLVRQD